MIQVAVDKLRYKLKTFNITGNLTDRTIDVKDANFEKLIRQLQKSIDKLRKMIDELLAGDKSLSDFFEKLVERFEKLSKQIRGLQRMIEKSTGATKTGQNEITSAEETIDMITKLLEEAEMMLKAEVEKILKAAESNRGDVSGLAKRMRAIAEEVLSNREIFVLCYQEFLVFFYKSLLTLFSQSNPLTTNVPEHIETSQLICIANQLTGFFIMGDIGR